jgi:hypothetical protein
MVFTYECVTPLPSKGKEFSQRITYLYEVQKEFFGNTVFKTTSFNRFGAYKGTGESVLGSY